MSKTFYHKNNQQTSQIYDLIDNIGGKLSQRNSQVNLFQNKNFMISRNNNQRYFDINNINNNPNFYQVNTSSNTYDLKDNQINTPVNQLTNYELRKIIKEEFESLYKPYHIAINNDFKKLRGEIINFNELNIFDKSNNFKNDKNEINFALNQIKNTLYDYVSLKEYNKKINELEEKINNNNSQKYQNYLIEQINNLNEEFQYIKNKFKEIYKKINNNPIGDFNQNDDNIKINEIKLNDIINKNSFLQKDIENCKQELNSIKNKINSSFIDKNNIINEVENKYILQ